ncbi:MAG TPA: carbohydrate kinase family protein [Spirochaetia bacterium]|nr:carbohydrate kinase family protein [Spirochaetia bacterium]
MTPSSSRQVVVCGHLCLDIIPGFPSIEGHDWFRPGRLSVVGAPVIATGGAVSNVGLSLHRLGLPVRLVAKIGADPLGRLILERVRGMGESLAGGLAIVPGETTSYTVVLNPPGIDRIFLHCPGANDTFTDADVTEAALEGAEVFHFGYPPLLKQIYSDGGVRLARILSRARESGALTSLDMSLPDPSSPSGLVDWGAVLSRVLPHVDLFVPSIEELLFMLDRAAFTRLAGASGGGDEIIRAVSFSDLAGIAARVHELGAPVVLVKLGDRGAYLHTSAAGLPGRTGWARRELYTPVFTVPKVAGTAGSGDATIAGFIASVVRNLGPEQSLTNAVAVGACCVEAPDATSGVRSWEETLSRVKSGWKRRSVQVEAGWTPAAEGVYGGPGDTP